MKYLPFLLAFFVSASIIAQENNKPLLDANAYTRWENLAGYGISDNGKYIWYAVQYTQSGDYLTLCTKNGSIIKKIADGSNASFTADNQYFLFNLPGDTLAIYHLQNNSLEYVAGVMNWKAFELNKKSVIVYNAADHFYIRDLQLDRIYSYPKATAYIINRQANTIAVNRGSGLYMIDLVNQKTTSVFEGDEISHLRFDQSGKQLLFLHKRSEANAQIYIYTYTDKRARVLVSTRDLPDGYKIANELLSFSKDGRYVYFKFSPWPPLEKGVEAFGSEPVIWSYTDRVLKHQEHLLQNPGRSLLAVISISHNKLVQLEDYHYEVIAGLTEFGNNRYVLTRKITSIEEAYWNKKEQPEYKLLSISDGKSIEFIPPAHTPNSGIYISPLETYVVWYNTNSNDFYAFDIAGANVNNITNAITFHQDSLPNDGGVSVARMDSFISGWLPNNAHFLVRDQFDIWQIDASNTTKPINLTGGYGRRHHIAFDVAHVAHDGNLDIQAKKIILVALDNATKSNGFASVKIGSNRGLQIHGLDSVLYCWHGMLNEPRKLLKAKKDDTYLITHQTASLAPNLCVSTDLKTFRQLTSIEPQRSFNWMTAELINWKKYDGEWGRGILYKPENFDPNNKYPVIFSYYQRRSEELHRFNPQHERGNDIEIPQYVSNGYVVFVPDIVNNKPGQVARTTVSTVESAAKYLMTTYNWVDGKRLGLQGHSFGGYETNILVAHSSLFAAACSSAGASDQVSKFGATGFGGRSLNNITEVGQTNLGTTPWEGPQVYIENSPIFQADKVVTPILIKHGKEDGVVPFAQAVEWFTALRRLQKPAWLLEYQDGHVMTGSPAATDFSVRQRQFFDYYLKGSPAPQWMTKGIAPEYENRVSGFPIDASDSVP